MPIDAWETHDPASLEVEALQRAYTNTLRAAIEADDPDAIQDDLTDQSSIQAIEQGNGAGVRLEDASVILATQSSHLDARLVREELLDRLLIGMTNAVMDVDMMASEISIGLSPKELQQRIEGRAPMTVSEYAHIRRAIARRTA